MLLVPSQLMLVDIWKAVVHVVGEGDVVRVVEFWVEILAQAIGISLDRFSMENY